MACSWWNRMVFVRTDVSEKRLASTIRAEWINELGSLDVTSNRRFGGIYRLHYEGGQLLLTSFVPRYQKTAFLMYVCHYWSVTANVFRTSLPEDGILNVCMPLLVWPAHSYAVFLLQTEIAKRLNAIIAQILPFLSQEVSGRLRPLWPAL
jgi:hypothetical protein